MQNRYKPLITVLSIALPIFLLLFLFYKNLARSKNRRPSSARSELEQTELGYDNCVYGQVISIQNDRAPKITLIVKDCLLGPFRKDQTLILQTASIFPVHLFYQNINQTIGRDCVFAFSEKYGKCNSRPSKTAQKQHIALELIDIDAPFPNQVFETTDLDKLKLTLHAQRARLIDNTISIIRNIWTKERIKDFCRIDARGQSAEDDLGPAEEYDYLLIPEDKKILYPANTKELGSVTWRARVFRSRVKTCQITIDKGNDHWCPALITPNKDAPKSAEDSLKERLEKTLSNVLTNHRLVHGIKEWSPPWSIKSINKSMSGRFNGFVLVKSDKHRYTGKLDKDLNIKAIYKNGKPDEDWAKAFSGAQLNYVRYLQNYCSGSLNNWHKEI